jgi:cytochrome oxidase Cu insertion factor (SCO1/SenC/PrrC family)
MEVGADIRPGPRRVRPVHVAIALIVAVLVGVGGAVALHSLLVTPAPASLAKQSAGLYGQATWPEGARPAPAITTLRDQTGHQFSLSSLRGHTIAVAFFDSYCTQACPLEGRALAIAERSLPVSRRPVLIVVSVNPLDTRGSVRAAVRKWGLARLAPWHWLMGKHARLAPVWKAYHIFVAPPSNGDISHTEALYLLDRSGYERSAYLYPFAPRFVTADLLTLARSRAAKVRGA